MKTYSFLDVDATLVGPGGVISLGNGSGPAEEGITVEMTEETDKMVVGADGEGMHSLSGARAGKMTVRLLKTSPVNRQLNQLYNLQRLGSATWGLNVITITDKARGDVIVGQEAAFVKLPTISYGKEAGMIEWEFNCVKVDGSLGAGV